MKLESVMYCKDNVLLDLMFEFYAPSAQRVIDVCCNARRMWRKTEWGQRVVYYDADPFVNPDAVCNWGALPDSSQSVDVLVYDPPHLPTAAASPKSLAHYAADYGLRLSTTADNIKALHAPFLLEARRVLKPDGLIFAKIKDYIHNHRYQWNLELFNTECRLLGLTPCDLIIKRDPAGGNLKSGRWVSHHHVKNVHCYWVVVRNSSKCERHGNQG